MLEGEAELREGPPPSAPRTEDRATITTAPAFCRFHNGTLLDRRLHGSRPHLELRGLGEQQAGEYHCKAWNEAGAVRSRAAQLTVLGEARRLGRLGAGAWAAARPPP